MSNDPVKEYKVLNNKPKSNEALDILKRISSQVKPILIKRNWKILNLCEFFPKNPNLLGLNVNKGWKINIRLRPHFDETQFLEYEDVLGTLLHEMVHIIQSPHDAHFYKILDELKQETEELMASGYQGEGFYSEGCQLGNRSVPRHKSNQMAAAAAEKRLNMSKIMLPSGGVRLGGSKKPYHVHLSPAQQAALAAEKRQQDQIWCGNEQEPVQKRKLSYSTIPLDATQPMKKTRVTVTNNTQQAEDDKQWACPSCTFFNKSLVLVCEICLNQRPQVIVIEDDDDTWSCPKCTLVNDTKWQTCVACNFVFLK